MGVNDGLKSRWFINFPDSRLQFPPSSRYRGSTHEHSTDSNSVEAILDGAEYMAIWRQLLATLIREGSGSVYLGTWVLNNVPLLGASEPRSALFQLLQEALAARVHVHILLGGPAWRGVDWTTGVNDNSLRELLRLRVTSVYWDGRYPVTGSCHQKFSIFISPTVREALLGSIDLSTSRWDTSDHLASDPNRPGGGATHELGLRIRGMAVLDILKTFVDRWNDGGVLQTVEPRLTLPLSSSFRSEGSASLQILHTYGKSYQRITGFNPIVPALARHVILSSLASVSFPYSWSVDGDFTIWASYLNAIRTARRYIYIEDQYFLPFGYPLLARSTAGRGRNSDLVYELGEALRRGVSVIVVTPAGSEDAAPPGGSTPNVPVHQVFQRNEGIRYLMTSTAPEPASNFVIAHADYFVHAKVMICDDQFAIVGSANFCQRSMTCDSELSVGIVDTPNNFPRELRRRLWSHHLQADVPAEIDPAIALLRRRLSESRGRLHTTTVPTAATVPPRHDVWMNNILDPYVGPRRD